MQVRFRQSGSGRDRRFQPPGGFVRIGRGRECLPERRQASGELFGARGGFSVVDGRRQDRDRLGAPAGLVEQEAQAKSGARVAGLQSDGLPVGPLGRRSFLEVMEHVAVRELRFRIARRARARPRRRPPGPLPVSLPVSAAGTTSNKTLGSPGRSASAASRCGAAVPNCPSSE